MMKTLLESHFKSKKWKIIIKKLGFLEGDGPKGGRLLDMGANLIFASEPHLLETNMYRF